MAFPSPVKNYHTSAYPAILPTRPELSTKGKNVVITGAGGGIGSAIAQAFAASGAATIGLVGRTIASLEATRKAILDEYPSAVVNVVSGDLAVSSSITAALADLAGRTASGRIDILVANAAYLSAGAFNSTDADDWWRGFEINVRGSFNLLRAFTPLAAEDNPVVINVSSGVVHLKMSGNSSYKTSKLAALEVFDSYRRENAHVHVYNFHPGVIKTDMFAKGAAAAEAQGSPITFPFDEVDLPASFAVWLASPEAQFLNGKLVWAHWDVDELKALAAAGEIGGPDDDKFTLALNGFPEGIKA